MSKWKTIFDHKPSEQVQKLINPRKNTETNLPNLCFNSNLVKQVSLQELVEILLVDTNQNCICQSK